MLADARSMFAEDLILGWIKRSCRLQNLQILVEFGSVGRSRHRHLHRGRLQNEPIPSWRWGNDETGRIARRPLHQSLPAKGGVSDHRQTEAIRHRKQVALGAAVSRV